MYTKETHPHIAIDFDDTISYDDFPRLGELKEGALNTIRGLQDAGYEINIWTSRGGYEEALGMKQEDAIIELLEDNGIDTTDIDVNEHFQYYLDNFPENSPKIAASVYIDDKNVGVEEINWYRIQPLFKDVDWSKYN